MHTHTSQTDRWGDSDIRNPNPKNTEPQTPTPSNPRRANAITLNPTETRDSRTLNNPSGGRQKRAGRGFELTTATQVSVGTVWLNEVE